MSKGSADTRTPNLKAREETWERVWGKKKREEEGYKEIRQNLKNAENPEEYIDIITKSNFGDRLNQYAKEFASVWNTLEAWRNRTLTSAGPYVYKEALRRAGEPVSIFQSDETGELLWVVSLEDSFWMDTFPTEEEAREFVEAVGWPVVE